jgi:hypothetical protein
VQQIHLDVILWEKTLNYKTEWHYWTGCVVEKPDGSRVLLKQMRDMEK